jgi:hypothetical protein
MLGAAGLTLVMGTAAGAAPAKNHSPNQEEAFPVVCNGVSYTLYDVPASGDHAEFTPAFVSGTNKVVVPFVFDASQTATVLTDGAVIEGSTYNAGDILFSGTEQLSIGAERPGGQTCTFGGEFNDTFPDDNGNPVQVQFEYSGVAQALFPNSR